ncbi:hypothetical protein U9M48_039835 [Paspalum notatum var. saurae]|uniref:Uncharacterized protein n=1 Tax=Paspalum notatum var. saurae TaxID=547442 RepID=A0AAQ3XEZ5_PASNO
MATTCLGPIKRVVPETHSCNRAKQGRRDGPPGLPRRMAPEIGQHETREGHGKSDADRGNPFTHTQDVER